ncbi:hypothetical protein V6N13_123883 [Hibiscus sabdariffa]
MGINDKEKQALAKQLNLRPRQVEVWFQNIRAMTKLKQTEVDCELLKKCCETLTGENKRLQKELQELKALNLAQPFYTLVLAAILTMCSSCEIVDGVGGGTSDNPFSVLAPNPHFYTPFTNTSEHDALFPFNPLSGMQQKEGKSMDQPHRLHPVGITRSPQGRLWYPGVADRP